MPTERFKKGKIGESIAEKFLTSLGYSIIESNFRCKYGEIDLIALAPEENPRITFIEVKCRYGEAFGEPEEAVDACKIKKILKTVNHFLIQREIFSPIVWSIDIIAIKLDSKNRLKEIKHLKQIYD